MQSPSPTPESLNDTDLERLDTLLETHAIPHDGMSLEMLDGFLSALLVSPEPVLPSEFIPAIWNQEPEWASADEAEEAMRLIIGLWNDIISRLRIEFGEDDIEAHAAAMPLLAYPAMTDEPETLDSLDGAGATADEEDDPFADAPADFPLGAAWALGFLRGVGMRQSAWEACAAQNDFVEDDLSMLEALALFSVEQAEELGLEADDIPEFSDRLDLVADLPAMLQDLYALNGATPTQQPIRRAEVPGRNDVCPCGSGKKFKRCCGAPKHLH